MYLTRLQIDTGRRSTMRALTTPSLFHGAIENSFRELPRARKLWRIDYLNGRCYLLLLSETPPDLTPVAEQFGIEENAAWETRPYGRLLDRIASGSVWRFRLTANPTKSSRASSDGGRGSVHAHNTVDYQRKWLLEQSEKHGFYLSEDDFDVSGSRWYQFRKGDGNRISILSATYDGILKVNDPELFRQALISGIGRGKAYGMGLLTIAGAAVSGNV